MTVSAIVVDDVDNDDDEEPTTTSNKKSNWLWKSLRFVDFRRRVRVVVGDDDAHEPHSRARSHDHRPPHDVTTTTSPPTITTTTTEQPTIHRQFKSFNYNNNHNQFHLGLSDRFVKPLIDKLAMKLSCCACCCFYPKYKRKVDNIYPRQVDAPLVKNEVDKLQYYVTVHPEKLSKIGDCLYHNLKRGLNGAHKNRNYVKNTIEAVEKILVVITPQNLNYFAPYYLKIIQKLLEQSGSSSTNATLVRSASAGKNN